MALNSADTAFVEKLWAILPEAAFAADPAGFLVEPRGRWIGQGVVVSPASVDEVSALMAACFEASVPVVPYAGGTGLVGGQVVENGPVPVVLSLARMNEIRAVYPDENVIEVDAGVILQDVQSAAEDAGRLFPLSLASEGSARIGGLLATNAGGLNVIRYGNARAQCLGIEAVLADGTIWNGMSRLRKDNTGYDLRDLMIGSEGSLGVITGASLRLMPRPAQEATAMFVVRSPAAAVSLLALAGERLGETISAFELIHRQGFDFLQEAGIDHKRPFEEAPEWSVLMKVGLPEGQSPQDALEALFEAGDGLVSDGVIAQSGQQAQALWDIRETIPEANKRIGSISSHDISVPISCVPEFIDRAPAILAKIGDFRINCFGHLGDGNLHYNVFPPKGRDRSEFVDQRDAIKTAVHDLAHSFGGSVSAEHGIGRLKVKDLETYGDPTKLVMMRAIKDALDPCGIMNPGAVLRAK
ncbi:FAD/FMN-containing dehydrogenase [Octadecabacter temperatus]|uniref:Putative FAD-linked oxidoreductase n=1 Tax=Octadecabacter temperatus TaxID=1458307 RepID=A0A0K0Y2Z1_9RHOB|nr:FAD-binding oxidoreductase [Octadecabacter temperatus]AKS45320.1 putative FAD-linked oxidoreductase [Octadecabacter temperatus]SIN90462.1 FAD/FMN-containing dehydrogenase [Octadecabacter temperatus]